MSEGSPRSNAQTLKKVVSKKEELGLTGDFKYKLVGRKIFNRYVIGRQENHFFIVCKIYSDTEPIINEESDSYRYFTEKEMKKELKENPKIFGKAFHFVVKTFFSDLLSE